MVSRRGARRGWRRAGAGARRHSAPATFTSRRKKMTWTTSKPLAAIRAAVVIALTGGLLIAAGTTAIASGSREGLEGAWTVQVTLRDCVTNAAVGAPFHSLVSFHDGGTLSESAGSLAFAAGQRSPGHGTWTREGRHTFLQRMIALILFDTPANLPVPPGSIRACLFPRASSRAGKPSPTRSRSATGTMPPRSGPTSSTRPMARCTGRAVRQRVRSASTSQSEGADRAADARPAAPSSKTVPGSRRQGFHGRDARPHRLTESALNGACP